MISPIEFRNRYISLMLSILSEDNEILQSMDEEELAELREMETEFVSFERATMERYPLSAETIDFLAASGLPESAAPFLGFTSYSADDLAQMYQDGEIPDSIFPLGSNGSGDRLGIEFATQAIVCLNHDSNMEREFINSSLALFAESLCLYQELNHQKWLDLFLPELKEIDPAAAMPGTMWYMEGQQ